VLDNNFGRHKIILEIIEQVLTNSTVNFYNKLSFEDINKIDCDYFIVHKNNDEFIFIESLNNCAYKRIFFSGGYNSIKEFPEDNSYYVPYKELFNFLNCLENG
jgi:hypothetical protein